MHVTTIKKSVAGCLLVITSFLLLAVPVKGTEQKLTTIKLVETYHSEAELQATYPELFSKRAIQDEGNYISFYDPEKRQFLAQLPKKQPEVLREEPLGNDIAIWRRTYRYQPSDDHNFLIVTEWEGGKLKYGDADPAELRGEPVKRVLYNTSGEKITELPRKVTSVELSPDKQHFLAMGGGEAGPLPIYLYSIDGTLLHTIEDAGLSVTFSQNGKFLQEVLSYQGTFRILSNTGELFYEGDYSQWTQHLEQVFVSENGTFLLVEAPLKISLFSINGEQIWEVPSSGVMHCYFNSDRGILQIITICKRLNQPGRIKDRYQLEIRSLESGQLLNTIEGVSLQSRFTQEMTIIHSGGKYHEYQIIPQ